MLLLKRKYNYYFFSVLSGILLWLGWPPFIFAPLLGLAFTPLLYVLEKTSKENDWLRAVTCTYLTFLTWNLLTTWWICLASPGGAVLAILANSLLMSIPFILFQKTKRVFPRNWTYLSLIVFWVSFEFLHLNWELAWPWLTLGNGMAEFPYWVQWYEYTGVLGGSVWILLVNIVFFHGAYMLLVPKFFLKYQNGHSLPETSRKMESLDTKIFVTLAGMMYAGPVLISSILLFYPDEPGDPVNIVVAQPNIDPYNEKYDALSQKYHMENLIDLAEHAVDSTIEYLIFPETVLPDEIWIDQINESPNIKTLRSYLKAYPNLKIIVGATLYQEYTEEKYLSPSARAFRNKDGWYDVYNSAIQIDTSQNIQFYHKSRLVPGVERIPYPSLFKILEPLAIDMGGTTGSLGTQPEREVFKSTYFSKSKINPEANIAIAPVICYESIFGEYVAEYIQKGANLIFIITNDGWWGNTAGYKQHLAYAGLRAIETRRWIARSANTGISSLISSTGDVWSKTKWWTREVIRVELYYQDRLTFYVRHGDYIGKIAMLFSAVLLIIYFIRRFKGKTIVN